MRFATATVIAAGSVALAALPAAARMIGVPTGQHARVMNDVARAQQQNDAAIAHVQRSIAATRLNKL